MKKENKEIEEIKENKIKPKIKQQIKEQTSGYLMAAFGLVAGLAWNEAIKALIEILFPFAKTGIFAKFFYAAFITVLIVVLSRYLSRAEAIAKK